MLRRRNWSKNRDRAGPGRILVNRRLDATLALSLALWMLPQTVAVAEEKGLGKLWIDLKSAFQAATETDEPLEESAAEEAPAADAVELATTPKLPPQRPSRELASVQRSLKALGYDPGPVDGLSGPRTRSAIRAYRKDRGLGGGTGIDESLSASLRNEKASNRVAKARPKAASPEPSRAANQASSAPRASREQTKLSTKARSFEFRGMRLGDSVERIRSLFPDARISSDERVYRGRSVVKSYFGVVEQQGLSMRFSRSRRLYRLNSAQLIDRSLPTAAVRAKFVEKYGEPDFEETLNEDGSAARLNWGTREGSGGAGMQVTVLLPANKDVTRINTRLWDDAAAHRNLADWSRAAKGDAKATVAAEEVNL